MFYKVICIYYIGRLEYKGYNIILIYYYSFIFKIINLLFFVYAGVHNYSSKHLDEAVELLSRTVDKYPFSKLLSPSYALSQFDDAVEEALSQSYLRVVIEAAQE